MRAPKVHARIIQHPFAHLMQGARLETFQIEGKYVLLDLQGFQQTSSHLFERDGRLFEKASGDHVPIHLCFSKVSKLKYSDFLAELDKYPLDDPSRIILGMYSWQQPGKQAVFYVIFWNGPVAANMTFFASDVVHQISNHKSTITYERNWSPAPPMPGRLVPHPKYLHKQFGGDPISIKVNDAVRYRRLFIGGRDIQPIPRPQIDAVLNLSEQVSRWVTGNTLHANDRAINRGEGPDGMTVSQILEEAEWVVKRLEQNRRVLVHCLAGMNRSVTVCCAVLMLLEGLSAEAALERVREQHPWARPDSHHWLKLRWLALNKKE